MNASSSTPVCIYCLERCFVPLPGDIKEKHRKKYIDRDVNLIATCQEGKKFEKERLGICYDDLQGA